ncbi:hypothetical protein NPIL_530241 [Nephila pilipes]|uniref:Uncharacterized protein n=1 Tax=Nephila pilipes TaxID=299642 RepID=A0A8X6T0V7_NEPPI|nr:hypothetical protein NPIL_530241 [Nephila pilipes]
MQLTVKVYGLADWCYQRGTADEWRPQHGLLFDRHGNMTDGVQVPPKEVGVQLAGLFRKREDASEKLFEKWKTTAAGMRRRVTAKQIMEVRSDRSFSQFQRRNPRRGTPTADNGQCFPTHIQS